MGYACYHSSVALLNGLIGAGTGVRNDLLGHLQLNFGLLGSMKRIYIPANTWVSVYTTK